MVEALAKRTEQNVSVQENARSGFAWRGPALILAACVALYFIRLGNFGVLEGGESYYPAAVREMVEAGDMLVPRLNYQLYFSKPILTFWLLGSAYYAFGVNEFAGRIWSSVLCTVLALFTYLATRAVTNARAGTLAGLMLASAPLMIATARRSSIDAFFGCFIGTAICATILTLFAKKKHWWCGIYISLALAVLTKGPAGLILFGIGAALFLLLRRPSLLECKQFVRELHVIPGALIFTALVVPWFVAIAQATKGMFLKVFFVYENLGRFAGVTNTKHSYWWWYLVTLLYGFFPWSLFLPASMAGAVKTGWKSSSGGETWLLGRTERGAVNALLFAASSAAAILIFFSLSKTQFETYVLPAWCPLAIVLGITVDAWLRRADLDALKAKTLKIASPVLAFCGGVLAIASVVAACMFAHDLEPWMRVALPVAGSILGFTWIAQYRRFAQGAAEKSMIYLLAGTCAAYALLTPIAFEVWYQKMFAGVQKIARSLENSDAQVTQYNDFMLSLLFYRKGPIDYFYHKEHIIPRSKCKPYDRRGIRSPLLVIVHKKKVNDILSRKNVHFTFKQQEGDWCLYESQDAVLRRPPTLEEMFRLFSWRDLIAGKMSSGPLTMPYGGGTLPERLLVQRDDGLTRGEELAQP